MTTMLLSCNQQKKKVANDDEMFVMEGFIEGIESDKVLIFNWHGHRDSAVITNGKFILKTKFKEPCFARLFVEKDEFMTHVFAENTSFSLQGVKGKGDDCIVKGGKEHDYLIKYNQQEKVLSVKYQIRDLYSKTREKGISNEKLAEVNEKINEYYKEINKLDLKFIKENPKAYYSIQLIETMASGASKQQIDDLLAQIDPVLKNTTSYKNIQNKMAELKNEASLSAFMSSATNVNYRVDEKFKGVDFKEVVYLGVFKNNTICALKDDGSVDIINTKGEKFGGFKAKLTGKSMSLAIDQSDNIYITDVQQRAKKMKMRGKVHMIDQPVGVEVLVYNQQGKLLRQFKAKDMISATGAKITGDKLIIADTRKGFLGIYNSKTGELHSKINDMRPCCNILDFAINEKNEVLVANLGAFRVQSFGLNGNNIMSFGSRGRNLDEFHGCCNPVSVTSLSTGAIVTVEKDPTRVKVYSKEGAKEIKGIEELVKGCLHIPMAVDANDNLYLASQKKGIVKCVSVN